MPPRRRPPAGDAGKDKKEGAMSTHRKPGPARTASAPGAEKLLEQFSSDRTIAEYAAEIWDAKPCPVP